VPEPAAVVAEYFDRIRARDASAVEFFAEDAVLEGLGRRTRGREAIRSFYSGVIEGASPTPKLVGELLCAGPRVAAEIQIGLANGATVHVVDLFEVEASRIRSLTYFVADHAPE